MRAKLFNSQHKHKNKSAKSKKLCIVKTNRWEIYKFHSQQNTEKNEVPDRYGMQTSHDMKSTHRYTITI